MAVARNYDNDGDRIAVTLGHIEGLKQCTVINPSGDTDRRVCLDVLTSDGSKVSLAIALENAADLHKGLGMILRHNSDPTNN